MRLIIPTPVMPPQIGGPATYVSQLAEHLSEHHKITILTFTQKPTPLTGVILIPLPLHRHPFGMFLRQAKLALEVARLSKQADCIFAQGPIVVGIASVVVGKIVRRSVIMKFVGDIAWEEAQRRGWTTKNLREFLRDEHKPIRIRLLQRVQQLALSWSRRIIVPSEHLKSILTGFYAVQPQKVVVVENPVKLPIIVKRDHRKKPLIISSGRLVPHKRFDLVIKTFAKMYRQGMLDQKYRLEIIGDGPQKKQLTRLVKNLKLMGRVRLRGALPRKKYLNALTQASVFVLASSYEGLPHAIIEAMLLGIPVVATDIPGNREVITDRKTGLLAQADTGSLARAMHDLLTDRRLAGQLTRYAKKQAQGRYSWKTHSERLIDLLRQELTAT